jgi:hypothetical protein
LVRKRQDEMQLISIEGSWIVQYNKAGFTTGISFASEVRGVY